MPEGIEHFRATFKNGDQDFAYAKEVYAAARQMLMRKENFNKTITEMHINISSYHRPVWKKISFSREKIFMNKKQKERR